METPYEYYDNKLGVKLKFLITDADRRHPDSLCLITYNAINKRLRRKTSSEQELRRACFGNDALVLFSSLDRATKDALTVRFGNPKEQTKKSWFAQHYMADTVAYDFFLAYTFGDDSKKLDLKLVDKYTYTASVLNTVIALKANRTEYIKARGALNVDIWESLSNDVNAFREVDHNLPTHKNSLRRKVTQYAKEGYACLISGKHCMKNAAKVKTQEQMALLDELLAKHTNLDDAQVCNLYNMVAERIDWATITAQTVANRKKKSGLITFAGRNSSTELSNKVLMQNKRSKPNHPMLYWTMDGWDAELLYQKTAIDKEGKTRTTYHNRLTMVVVLDPFNKYPIGYAIGTHETPELIQQALLNALCHTKELFGSYYKPYQLQTDNYAKKALTPIYEACTKHYIPARVKNAKAKVIEPYFGYINKKYCQMFDNWSGFGVQSGSKNQPNSEYLNKIRHHFPSQEGCYQQLENIILAERTAKKSEFLNKWQDVTNQYRLPMTKESLLIALGASSGKTNRLTGEGIRIKVKGETLFYDSFDLNFRKLKHLDWQIKYNPNNLEEAIAISPNGEYRFELEPKYTQPMALAEQNQTDVEQRVRVNNYNKELTSYIIEERQKNNAILEPLFENPLLNDTLAKHLLVDSQGQHKNQRNHEKNTLAAAEKLLLRQEKVIKKTAEKTWQDEQDEYIKSKLDLNKYANTL